MLSPRKTTRSPSWMRKSAPSVVAAQASERRRINLRESGFISTVGLAFTGPRRKDAMVWVQLGFGTEFQLLARSAGLQFAGLWDRMGVAKLSTALPIREHCRLPTCDT